ncbi:hypothetical protein V5O48_007979 [Marasmius crinis-equi]|uniref:Pre-rRNA-processing protein RIX1 n=1 Tax=Marasmius crinis-equi TaxID=585013 RepID=A0ABR3FF39_9AGAR
MTDTHPLKTFLNVHLASDASVAVHIPYISQILSSEHLSSSPHLSKWLLRVNSLVHSKDTSARWGGLCLAHTTASRSKPLMIENAQSWLQVALPILSRKEPPPVTKAALNLCRVIFTTAHDSPEFQRQVSTPNVPKFTAALIQCVESTTVELDIKVLALRTITRLVPIYPNIHRANHASLSTLTLRILSANTTHSSRTLRDPAAELYSVLHLTGGKVGAATLWRKSLDERLADAWNAFGALRTSFKGGPVPSSDGSSDPAVAVSYNLESLSTSVLILRRLLQSPTSRPVQVPVGPLVKFAIALLTVTEDEEVQSHAPSSVRALEVAVIPSIHRVACEFTACLAKCVTDHLTPYLTRICTYIAFHLEQQLEPSERLSLLQTLGVLLTNCRSLSSPVLATRVARAVLSSVKVILPSQTDSGASLDAQSGSKSKKGKKRARGYEGDEVFKTSISVICPSVVEGKVLLEACDVLQKLLRNPDVSSAMHSLACRVVLAAIISLPQLAAALVSPDVQLYQQLLKRLQSLAMELGQGTTSAMGKSLGLVIHALSMANVDEDTMRNLDVLLHPRLPPLLRSLPQLEALSLFRTEESEEEAAERQRLGLETNAGVGEIYENRVLTTEQDIIMKDAPATEINSIPPSTSTAPASAPRIHPSVIAPLASQAPAPQNSAPLPKPVAEVPVHSKRPVEAVKKIPQPTEDPRVSDFSVTGVSTPNISHQATKSDETPSVTQTPQVHEVDQMPSIDVDSDSESDD